MDAAAGFSSLRDPRVAARAQPGLPEVRTLLERLSLLHPQAIDYALERMDRLLADLGRPERRLPPVIHVAGTNGKGSTLAIMRTLLEAGGRRVHSYTSPHLVRFNERIRLAGVHGSAPVDDVVLAQALQRILTANAGRPLTFFEGTTAAAFLLFAIFPADVVLLETGMGGRLDATNVVPRPAATAITSLSYDHEAFLGHTIQAIAAEKAGILRPGVPAVLARQSYDAGSGTILRIADEIGAPLRRADADFSALARGDGLSYRAGGARLLPPFPGLSGQHQIDNAATAIATLEMAGFAPSARLLRRALPHVRWPGRLQRLNAAGPIFGVGDATHFLLDGGHNPGAADVVAREVARLDMADPRRTILVFGMLRTKNASGFLRPYAPLVDRTVALPLAFADCPAFTPEELCEFAAGLASPVRRRILSTRLSISRPATARRRRRG
ncbi:bifunctional folylpolyglutamate synthase/dihydrofolate synthase [Roseixanthobacter glucoisosaccharinicivorans]|uniref:bifunctional folylpolyglutamate synthase/dihydrofolate synthase n=1 Tax=Roseixanthobacter glucoisosaccharinicivorans TaxID=3119923 RepID=UPI003728D11C